jgi:hypothetical protein
VKNCPEEKKREKGPEKSSLENLAVTLVRPREDI